MVINRKCAGLPNTETSEHERDALIARKDDNSAGRSGKSCERVSVGQTRRNVLVKSGGALMALFTGGIASAVSTAAAGENSSPRGLQHEFAAASKPGLPTPAEFVELGGYLSFLCNLPTGARLGNVVLAVGRLLRILRDRDLPATQAEAKERNIWFMQCHYACCSRVLSENSKREIAEKIAPLRVVFEEEVAGLDWSVSRELKPEV